MFRGLGSSPLARGTYGGETQEEGIRRLIPARAGNTHLNKTHSKVSRAHPRSRGEHYEPAGIVHRDEGSSPLTRGTHDPTPQSLDVQGLIPARAGNISLVNVM